MFANVSCSQCGREFGPGYHGYSDCREHTEVWGPAPPAPVPSADLVAEYDDFVARYQQADVVPRDWAQRARDTLAALEQERRIPREPTSAMNDAGMTALADTPTTICSTYLDDAWRAMWDAAQEPASGGKT
jgi:hypothetical protein